MGPSDHPALTPGVEVRGTHGPPSLETLWVSGMRPNKRPPGAADLS